MTESPAVSDAIDDSTGDFPAGALEQLDMLGAPAQERREPPRLETWLEREERLRLERIERAEAARLEAERRGDAVIARMRARACDNGNGACRYCGVLLTTDETGAQAHPDGMCPGPGRVCDTCGKPWTFDSRTGRWNPTCAPAEHESRARAVTWQLATARLNPLSPPPRVYKDDAEGDE